MLHVLVPLSWTRPVRYMCAADCSRTCSLRSQYFLRSRCWFPLYFAPNIILKDQTGCAGVLKKIELGRPASSVPRLQQVHIEISMVTLGRVTNLPELDRRRRQCFGLTILARDHNRHIPWKKTATSPTVSDCTTRISSLGTPIYYSSLVACSESNPFILDRSSEDKLYPWW